MTPKVPEAGPARRAYGKRPWVWVVAAVAVLVVAGIAAGQAGSTRANHRAPTSSPASRALGSTTASGGGEDDLSGPGAPTVSGQPVSPGSGHDTGPSGCRAGDPLANVYHPNRLHVVQACTRVSGTVKTVRAEDDGDVHFDLALDPAYTNLLTSENYSAQHGWLVVEIVPADEPGCTPGQPPKPATGTYDYGICTGADESTPAVGSHVYVTGPYVLDEDHGGWAEVHPAWAISGMPIGSPPQATTAAPITAATAPPTTVPPPPPTAAPAGCYPRASSGNCYEPGELCPTADHGTTGVAGDGERIVCQDNNGWRWEPY